MKSIIGRSAEKTRLENFLKASTSLMLPIHGRRRIGKSWLVDEFFTYKENQGQCLYFKATGNKKFKKKEHLVYFLERLTDKFPNVSKEPLKDWADGFGKLKYCIDEQISKNPDQSIVVFLDELAYFANKKAKFLEELSQIWNDSFSASKYKKVKIIICSSSTSWIIKIIDDTNSFFKRMTPSIHLEPFTIKEVDLYLQSKNINLNELNLLKVYFALGGVAEYYKNIPDGQAWEAKKIIDYLYFETSYLKNEFSTIFKASFDSFENHKAMIEVLAGKKEGLTQAQIVSAMGKKPSGKHIKYLQDLEKSSLIYSIKSLSEHRVKKGKESKQENELNIRYKISDEYLSFYLYWIKELGCDQEVPDSGHHHDTWVGTAFERFCHKNIDPIKKELGIPKNANAFWWSGKTKLGEGAEIDLVVKTAKASYIFEAKFYSSVFSIKTKYSKELKNKLVAFKEFLTQTDPLLDPQLFLVMVSYNGVAENKIYKSLKATQVLTNILLK